MSSEGWWSLLDAAKHHSLFANNGDALPDEIIAKREAASGEVEPSAMVRPQ